MFLLFQMSDVHKKVNQFLGTEDWENEKDKTSLITTALLDTILGAKDLSILLT